jgi:hypothetical protein
MKSTEYIDDEENENLRNCVFFYKFLRSFHSLTLHLMSCCVEGDHLEIFNLIIDNLKFSEKKNFLHIEDSRLETGRL